MPAGFDSCRASGGRIRTKRVNSKQYMHICFKGEKSYPGEVKEYKKILKK
jgi:hypothetical protein